MCRSTFWDCTTYPIPLSLEILIFFLKLSIMRLKTWGLQYVWISTVFVCVWWVHLTGAYDKRLYGQRFVDTWPSHLYELIGYLVLKYGVTLHTPYYHPLGYNNLHSSGKVALSLTLGVSVSEVMFAAVRAVVGVPSSSLSLSLGKAAATPSIKRAARGLFSSQSKHDSFPSQSMHFTQNSIIWRGGLHTLAIYCRSDGQVSTSLKTFILQFSVSQRCHLPACCANPLALCREFWYHRYMCIYIYIYFLVCFCFWLLTY